MPAPTYDMSAPDNPRRPNNRTVEYQYGDRRIKAAPTAAARAAAAGAPLVPQFKGGATPLKGKGAPPPSDNEAAARPPSVRIVAGARSYKPTDALAAGAVGDAASAPQPQAAFRPAVRQFGAAFESSMQGTSAVVTKEDEPHRPIRRHGAEAPADDVCTTKARAIVDAVPAGGKLEAWEVPPRSCLRNWEVPAKANNNPITRHRMSDPMTEPAAPKLDAGRTPAPHASPVQAAASRDAFFAAVGGYQANKVKGVYGSSIRLG